MTAKGITKKHLLLFYFEDSLKKFYFTFIQKIEELSKDALLHVKNKTLLYTFDLLVSKPEQEQNLLALLVNKLVFHSSNRQGDLEKRIASKAVHLLSLLLSSHPNMKLIVIKETEQLLFRLNISQRAQYYAVTFLNQIILSKQEVDIAAANRLIEIYFRIFEVLVSQIKSDKKAAMVVDGINAKMMAGLLTGINRAFPFSKLDSQVFVICLSLDSISMSICFLR